MNKWIVCFELFVHCMCLVTDVWIIHTVVSFPLCFLYLNLLNIYKAMCCHLQCTFELNISVFFLMLVGMLVISFTLGRDVVS